jgi:hypothetical protein
MSEEISPFAASGETNPAGFAASVTPADTNLGYLTRAVYVGVGGNLVVKMAGNGVIVTFTDVPTGSLLPIRVTEIRSATTALAVLALY